DADVCTIPAMKQALERFDECEVVGRGLTMPARIVGDVADAFGLFNGFDEVWWFSQKPRLPLPNAVTIVAPLDLRIDDVPQGLQDWMTASGCHLGLGDGIGMNFATPDATIARYFSVNSG